LLNSSIIICLDGLKISGPLTIIWGATGCRRINPLFPGKMELCAV
jgi:hypothetical protein